MRYSDDRRARGPWRERERRRDGGREEEAIPELEVARARGGRRRQRSQEEYGLRTRSLQRPHCHCHRVQIPPSWIIYSMAASVGRGGGLPHAHFVRREKMNEERTNLFDNAKTKTCSSPICNPNPQTVHPVSRPARPRPPSSVASAPPPIPDSRFHLLSSTHAPSYPILSYP